MEEVKRINFLDRLRAFIIFLVIMLHTSMAYLSTVFPGWAHNREKNDVLAYLMLIVFDSPFLMVVMFFIAGYFTLPSLIKKGTKIFLKDKLIHIGIPFLVGATVISATLGCISYYSDGNKGGFLECFLSFFLPKYYGQYHFWFLGMLLYFFILTVLFIKLFKLSPGNVSPGKFSFRFFILFTACTTVAFFVVGTLVGSYSYWMRFYLLQCQVPAIPLYMAFYLLGFYAYKKDWFRAGYSPRIIPWTLLYIVSMLTYVTFYVVIGKLNPTTVDSRIIVSLSFNTALLSWLLMLLGIFKRFMNRENGKMHDITQSSFGAYLMHMYPIFAVIYFTEFLLLPSVPKYIIQAFLCVVLSWTLGYLLKKTPVLKKIL